MTEHVMIRWTLDLSGQFCSGELPMPRTDWDAADELERLDAVKTLVGRRVVEVLDVDYEPTNAAWDDPAMSDELTTLRRKLAAVESLTRDADGHDLGHDIPVGELTRTLKEG